MQRGPVPNVRIEHIVTQTVECGTKGICSAPAIRYHRQRGHVSDVRTEPIAPLFINGSYHYFRIVNSAKFFNSYINTNPLLDNYSCEHYYICNEI